MKKIKILKFCMLITSISFAQDKIWTLEQCVDHALENNITILQAENSLLSSELLIMIMWSLFFFAPTGHLDVGTVP